MMAENFGKVTKYRILWTGEGTSLLEEKVESHLKKGWKLQGGVCTIFMADHYCYAQAVIKEITDYDAPSTF